MPLKPPSPSSFRPASPALNTPSFPASPTLEDLGDPAWIDAYRRAGGHVRTIRTADDAQRRHQIVTAAAHSPGMPSPSVLRLVHDTRAKAATVLDAGLQEDIGRVEDLVQAITPSNPVVPPQPAQPESVPSGDLQEDAVLADLQRRATAWLGMFCPKTCACMDAAHDAIRRRDSESLAHAATSLRRALTDLADHVEPPGPGTRLDHTGEERKVGREQFRNRLYIYLGKKLESSHQRKLALAELDLIEHQLIALTDALGKAVHADSIEPQLEQVYIATWSVISQVVHCAESAA